MHARTRQTCLLAAVVVTLVVSLAGTALAQPANSSIGAWRVNLAKSEYAAGTAPKNAFFTIEAAGAGITATVDAVSADGTVAHWGFTVNYDGKDNPITGNSPYGDVVASTRVDANTTKNVYKKGGAVTVTQTHVVSSDGNTDTITNTGTTAAGQTITTVRVYDKQTNIGTWKLNLAKSTYSPGTAPRSATFTNALVSTGVKTVSDSVRTDGTPVHFEYTLAYDGKDYPISGNSPSGDVTAATRLDAYTVRFTYKKDGTLTITQTSVASADGKTYTITAKGTNTLGQAVDTVAVYDRQ